MEKYTITMCLVLDWYVIVYGQNKINMLGAEVECYNNKNTVCKDQYSQQ